MLISSDRVTSRALAGERLSRDEILSLYELPPAELAEAANAVRLGRADPELVTYSIGGNVDYTNVCVVACKFCAFYRARHQEGAFTLSLAEIGEQLDALAEVGIGDVLIQGGVNPDLPFDWYLELMRFLKAEYPGLHVDALSPEEVLGLEKLTGRRAPELLAELQAAGMDGIPGAAAEILADEVRSRIAPARIGTADWFRIIDAAQELGLHVPWVGLVFGFGETREQRVDHLLALRAQQGRALARGGSGFTAFKVWPVRLANTRLAGQDSSTAEEIVEQYVQEVAIARLALDNVAHHRAVWRTMGFGVASRALRAGADDLCCTGSINAIDAVMRANGREVRRPSQDLIEQVGDCVRDAGFTPALRDPYYNVIRIDGGGGARAA